MDLAELFKNAARGMFAIMASVDRVGAGEEVSVEVCADDLENLLVNWLSELLYLSASKGMLFRRVDIVKIERGRVEGRAFGEPIDQVRHELYGEIKAVTYHELKVEEIEGGWIATVLFDI